MYCTLDDLRRLLPEKITIGDQNIGTPNPGRPVTKRESFTPQEATTYIGYAQQEIDGRLSGQFFCPLRRVKTFETEMLENVTAGTNVKIRIHDSGAFCVGQLVRLQDNDKMETANVTSLVYLTEIIVDRVKYSYNFENGIISILEYPDPIPLITARLAVSYAFDELFVAEQSPNISEYGKELRKLALNSLDSVLSGTILLFGQDYVGRRFLRGTLLDAYDSPTKEFQFGREKQ